MGPPCSASLFSGCAQTEYTSWRAWNRARLVYWILGHKCGPCPRTAGPFKTGLSLIGHTSVAPSRLRARQLIREQNKAGLLQAGRLSTLHTVNRMESIFYFLKHVLASPLLGDSGNCCKDRRLGIVYQNKYGMHSVTLFNRDQIISISDGKKLDLNVCIGVGKVRFMSPDALCIQPCSCSCFERLICS